VTHNPRYAAFTTLLRIEKERSYADILIDRELREGRLAGPDRGLYTELVYGTLRRRGTLDHIIATFSTTPPSRLERSVILLLRLGLYQLFYLDRVPVSAAVNETVNLAKQAAPRGAGFINAVLRAAERGREKITYPDPGEHPAEYLALRHSHPRWIVTDWIGQLGFDEAEELASLMSTPPSMTIRTNRVKSSPDDLRQRLAIEGVSTIPCRHSPDGLVITSAISLGSLPSFREGLFVVQDEASQLAALLLTPEGGDTILDLCAAPGGKATYLAAMAGPGGRVIACDRSPRKLEQVKEAASRLGIATITTIPMDATKPLQELLPTPFDRILVDAPCSGLGVIHRNPEGKWWKEPTDPARLAVTQLNILANAARCLKPGGVLVYSTCSTSLEENEGVVENFLNDHPDFVIEPVSVALPILADMESGSGFFRSWPHRHAMDGFFAARMRKRERN